MSDTIKAAELETAKKNDKTIILDVRRKADKEASTDAIPGAEWHDPEKVDEWIDTLPEGAEPVIYCVRGGAISKDITCKLQEKGLNARYIEGGITAWKEESEKK